MPEPKQKLSKYRTNRRRSTQKLRMSSFILCPKCKSKVLPHHACPTCGTYKGREILKTKSKITKKIKGKKED